MKRFVLKSLHGVDNLNVASVYLSLLFIFLLTGCGTKKPVEVVLPQEPLSPSIETWHHMIQENQDVTEIQKIYLVNSFFNQLEFVDDSVVWAQKEYWATPMEFINKGAGDCEDFAIAKYFTLRYLRVPDDKMRITYVIALNREDPHMVLSFYAVPQADPLVLDSLTPIVSKASERNDLIPVYSFNAGGLWLAKKRQSERLRGSEGLSLWQDLLKRFNSEAMANPIPQ